MIRHCCAACGRPINRTDRFFEPSDGTLCRECLLSMGHGKKFHPGQRTGWPSALPLVILAASTPAGR